MPSAVSLLGAKIAQNSELVAELEKLLAAVQTPRADGSTNRLPAPGRRSDHRPKSSRSPSTDFENSGADEAKNGDSLWKRIFGARNRGQEATDEAPAALKRKASDIPADFDEDAYLFLNPDVSEAVSKGLFKSGYQHWASMGRAEGRGGGPWEQIPDRSQFLELAESRPYGVNLYGFLSAVSGLGSVARSCVRAIETTDIPFQKISIPSWGEAVSERSLPDFSPYRANLLLQNPDSLALFFRTYGTELLKGCYNIGYWFWELPSARSDWHHLYRYVDEIWVASKFCRDAFQLLTKLPVKVMPVVVEGLENKVTYSRKHFGLPRDVFVFGYIFDVSSYFERKNPLALVEAFKREFGASGDVMLCLKYFNSRYDEHNVRLLEEAVAGVPNIRTFPALMDDNEIVSLQNSFDCLVSPHRGEGFGFNLAESMYLGKPVIATRYSSNLDFMRDDNSYLIDYKLTPIALTMGPYLRGHLWADPSIDHLCQLMRTVFEDSEGREQKGRRAAEEIRKNYSAAAVGRTISDRLEEIGLESPRLSRSIFQVHGAGGPARLLQSDTPADVVAEIRGWSSKPLISIITPVYNVKAEYLRRCIDSVREQHYPFWELCLCDDGSTLPETIETLESYRGTDARIKITRLERNQGISAASNRAAEFSTGEYLAMLDNDDELAPEALYEVAKAVQANPEIDLLYTDEDKIDEYGDLGDHYYKPDWSPEHLLSVMYMLHLLVIRKDLFFSIGGFRSEFSGAQDYDLALRATTEAEWIHHVPRILYHWRKGEGSAASLVYAKPDALDAGRRALEDHVWRNGIDATIEEGQIEGTFRVRHRIHGNPRVSLCVMTIDAKATVPGRGEIYLLEHFVKSIAEKTDYPNYEIVLVDDGNISERTHRALAGIPYRVVSFTVPNKPFNHSKKANFTMQQARGRHIVLLNDDMEVITPGWLSAMIEFNQQEEIGMVGARLLFPDERIQHVGVVMGVNSGAAHAFHEYPAGTIGYNAYTHLIRNYSAVTAACIATRMDVIEKAGGFDEAFATDFNDIDWCLRIVQKGYRIVYTPYAELYHFEGLSNNRRVQDPKEIALFNSRWPEEIRNDPYYNPNLTRVGVDFSTDARILLQRKRSRSKHAADN